MIVCSTAFCALRHVGQAASASAQPSARATAGGGVAGHRRPTTLDELPLSVTVAQRVELDEPGLRVAHIGIASVSRPATIEPSTPIGCAIAFDASNNDVVGKGPDFS